VATEKICYFRIMRMEDVATQVRFGFARRDSCQVGVDLERWEEIAPRLRSRGYRPVERAGKRCERSFSSREGAASQDTWEVALPLGTASAWPRRRVSTL
jgi:hypothetical protein